MKSKTKRCNCCKIIKPLKQFGKSKRNKDGYKCQCKDCARLKQKDYYKRNKEEINIKSKANYRNNIDYYTNYGKERYIENKEEAKIYGAKYYKNHKEEKAQKAKVYRKKNKETISKRQKQYRTENKEKVTEYNRGWRKRNPDKAALANSHRTFYLKRAVPSWYDDEEEKLVKEIYLKRDELNDKLGTNFEVDHIIPINPKDKSVCGLHCWANLQLLDGEMNYQKNDQYQKDW